MNTHNSEVQNRLVEGIEQLLRAYESGTISLPSLASDLKPLVVALLEIDDEWGSDVKDRWNQLEYTNAFFIESGRAHLTQAEEAEVRSALADLRDGLSWEPPQQS